MSACRKIIAGVTIKIMNNEKIEISFSQSDLEDLINGEKFDWTFETNTGRSIDVHLINEDYE